MTLDSPARLKALGWGRPLFFVVDLDGAPVGGVSLFHFDLFAGHAAAGISLLPNARVEALERRQ